MQKKRIKKMQTSELTFSEFHKKISKLSKLDIVFIDDIPKCLEKDFNKFIVGKTLTKINDSVATFDFKQYYDKIFLKKGIGYRIKFKM